MHGYETFPLFRDRNLFSTHFSTPDAGAVTVRGAYFVHAQAGSEPAPAVPDWAQPGSPTHVQVPPPADFHRPSRNFETQIGVFQGQSDIGGAVVPGSASYDAGTQQYTIHSAGYNIWYSRDEFRFLWKKMSGDFSLAADVTFPDSKGYGDRKVVLVIRQNLEDDSKEAMLGEHGVGMIHLAWRPDKGAMMKDAQFRFGGTLAGVKAKRVGIEKHGDAIAIFVSLEGEPMHQLGPPINLHFDEPFYVGVGFCFAFAGHAGYGRALQRPAGELGGQRAIDLIEIF